jgi:hypothetical protein
MIFTENPSGEHHTSFDTQNQLMSSHRDLVNTSVMTGATVGGLNKQEILKEGELNKQYRLMCAKPRRLLVKFYTTLEKKEG